MAVRNPYMVKQVAGATDLALTAEAGKSLLITGVYLANSVGAYATLVTEKTTVGYFRAAGTLGNHLFGQYSGNTIPNLLAQLIRAGHMVGYPVAQGETFRITGVAQATSVQWVTYMEADAGDYKNTDPNGSQAGEYFYVSYGRAAAALAAGSNAFTVAQTPAEFPSFPWAETVPPGHTITLLGIAASEVGRTSGTAANKHRTDYVKLVQDRVVLFDLDRNGILMRGAPPAADGFAIGDNISLLFNNSQLDLRPIQLFATPLVFMAGAELNVSVFTTVELGVANLDVADTELGFLQHVKKG